VNKRPEDAGDDMAVDIDPTLAHQIAVADDDAVVEAVLVLRQHGALRCRSEIEPLLQRLGQNEPAGAIQHTLLPRLGVLIVRASARIICRLIAEPTIMVASENWRADSGVVWCNQGIVSDAGDTGDRVPRIDDVHTR